MTGIVKLIKKSARVTHEEPAPKPFVRKEHHWSKAVKSWVEEFQERTRTQSPPAFDRIFKDALE